jgi:hypothetical protein
LIFEKKFRGALYTSSLTPKHPPPLPQSPTAYTIVLYSYFTTA